NARKRCKRCAVEDEIADGIFDATVDPVSYLRVASANPAVLCNAFLDLAPGKPGIRVEAKSFLDFFKVKEADRPGSLPGDKNSGKERNRDVQRSRQNSKGTPSEREHR